jgi:hypothetical protein
LREVVFMASDNRDVLDVLKAELEFLEKGGYAGSPTTPWRPKLIFQDSPTCPNYAGKDEPVCCKECLLMRFVPADSRNEKVPCRHITLNIEGYTIDTFYRLGTQEKLEEAMSAWLHKTIYRLERERNLVKGPASACYRD